MALTQSEWAVKTVEEKLVMQCTVTCTTAENDAYTKATPRDLDTKKPFILILSTSAALDGAAVPLDVWVGYDPSFALSGNDSTVAATFGHKFQQITDDNGYAVASTAVFFFDPNLPVAQVVTIAAIATGYKVRTPCAPRLAFNLNGGSTLLACTATFTIIQ
jgi:hypothetical protein